ncbi:AAA family ATPase [Carnobacterium inhibens]|uniref:AAA family ATPase n=1 Tax=Carnobacterium inhibens TaxID=147709 RepID=UPI000558530B|nr:AAA family ATPase [Carnobacterium inhibens]
MNIKKDKRRRKKSFPKIIFPNINYQELLNETNGIIKETIIPSVIIKEFQDNPQKQQWAKNGMELHKETDICSFCGNELTNNRYEELDNFFSDSVTILEKKILKFKEKLVNEKEKLLSLEPLSEKDFYIEYQRNIKELNYNIQQEKTIGILFIEKLITVIDKKSNSLFQKIEEIEEDLPNGFYLETEGINDIYKKIYLKNNQSAQNLDEKKDECRKELRKDVINDKLSQIEYEDNNYYDLNQRIDVLKEQLVEEKKILQESDEKIETLSKKIEKLGKNQKNEKNAANQINTYLNNRLGQDELHLDINKDKNNQYSFAIFRQGNPAYNLSEGEMTLISFAYYLASLKTLSEDERKKVIIVIDDPISSLDENNIFYIYSLISGEIISKDSDQIFITTHNLDFLKYVMRYKINAKQTKYLIINKSKEENGNWRSSITQMPKYMSSKVTEFNFLFEQIYTVAKDDINDKNYNVYYNFPNNARKFLEALLFFKYPSYIDEKNDSLWRFKKFFGEGIEETFINRINNEYSHGMDRFDRVSQKLNSSEFSKDATLILRTIKSKDYDQYESFLNNSKLSDCNWN